eukprot:TRINITY_DN2368_c1_g1_i1.p1 TRINITY_DN2368_c1_g1~~TRINITY_DN2368_c1_g1_i1.p1  ORF type:complete len:319 (-),score=54.48 TRINITY_DN2368_c1_g1_i1:39-995(-)
MLRIFIVSNLIPGDPTSIDIVKKIKERVSAHESPAMLVDLGAENSAYSKDSHEYYALLAPVIENVPYHPIRRVRDNAVESVDFLDIGGVKLLFPFIENYHPSDEQHHSEIQNVLSNALQNPNPHLSVVFQRDVFVGSNKDQEKALATALEKLFVNAHISLVVSGGAKVYARKATSGRENSLPIYVTTGIGSSNFSALKPPSGELIAKYKPSFGELTINCSLSFNYQQRDILGNSIDTFDYDVEGVDGSDAKHSNEKIIAIIVLGCSLAFLGYFIYSWVSCYLKKPRVIEREEVSSGIGENREGYVMQPMTVAPKQSSL